MRLGHTPMQLLAVMVVVVFTTGQCQENDSHSNRRAVTEHQLMHDRGRTMQSLKRLIWLSSAMEGLHTAQTRSSPFPVPGTLSMALNQALLPATDRGAPSASDDSQQKVAVENLLKDFFSPYLMALPNGEV